MSQTRISDREILLRKARVSLLKANRGQVLEVENLKNTVEWKSLKSILDSRIKSFDTIIDMSLDVDVHGLDSLIATNHDAREARCKKKILAEIISMIENPGDTIKRLDGEISSIQELIERVEAGSLV